MEGKHKNFIKLHLIATAIATILISSFFILSLYAEFNADINYIKIVKKGIVHTVPLLIVVMPIIAITGKKLAGNSRNPLVLIKKNRMKLIMVNGLILVSLAILLNYMVHKNGVNATFLVTQIVEFIFGLMNLTLIGLNIKSGLQLSSRNKTKKEVPI